MCPPLPADDYDCIVESYQSGRASMFTSTKEVAYYSLDAVCLFVSVCVQNVSKNYKWILMKFCGEVEHGPERN